MANFTLNCASCGAPVEYNGSDVPGVICPFCGTTVIIPREMRPDKPREIYHPVPINTGPGASSTSGSPRIRWILGGLILFVILCMGITSLIPTFRSTQDQSIASQILEAPTEAPLPPTASPAPTQLPSPTPGYEVPGVTFGEKGINPGQFDDSRFIATDGSRTIYIADFSGGRVQAFDMTGKYLYQWKVGSEKTIFEGLAADHQGGVYLSDGSEIYHVDGKTGELLGKLSSPKGGEFGDLLVSPEGNLVAVWYEERWGLITSLEGHSEDIVFFNPSGTIIKTLSSPISTQTEELALDIFIAIDGKDNLYALNQGVVYIFNPDGKYLNKFGSTGSGPGQFSSPGAICIDRQGQVIIGDSNLIDVFTPEGRFIANFKNRGSTSGMAYDDKGALWVLAYDRVTQFLKPGE